MNAKQSSLPMRAALAKQKQVLSPSIITSHQILINRWQLLVPKRLIDSWCDELLSVNRRHSRGRIVMGDRQCSSTRVHVEKNRIYLVSKDSVQRPLGRHQPNLDRARTQSFTDPFSLVVVGMRLIAQQRWKTRQRRGKLPMPISIPDVRCRFRALQGVCDQNHRHHCFPIVVAVE